MNNNEVTTAAIAAVLKRNGLSKAEVAQDTAALAPIANDYDAMVAYFTLTHWSAQDAADLATEIADRLAR